MRVFLDLLAEQNRIIVITGASGSGKTSFSAAAARAFEGRKIFLSTRLGDGACFDLPLRGRSTPRVMVTKDVEALAILEAVRSDTLVVIDDLDRLLQRSNGTGYPLSLFLSALLQIPRPPQVILTLPSLGVDGGIGAHTCHAVDAYGVLEMAQDRASAALHVSRNRGGHCGDYDFTAHVRTARPG